MPNIKLDHCVIHVSDWERSNTFYHAVLGAELVPVGSGWSYRFGETQLNLHGPGVQGTPVAQLPVQPGGSDLHFIYPGTISEAQKHLKRHGVEVELEPVQRCGKKGLGMSAYFQDPDGSLLEFISYQT
ncbi:VOC family protein [Chroococcidiopsis sp. TS-821]|uniref:VOC family protein n=1 Tax=Chroococcidiopsis sp. TS-821 TaxID=1378066 RepID=UPI000CEEFBD4|nr:VOC family protein [Chroococcidiopsis sp. TS-821]PPS42330.1 VOC family virulence protein [Chroococcidiopsis sp. TS-821]